MTLPGNQNSPNQVHKTAASLEVKSGSPTASPQSSPQPITKVHHKREPSVSSSRESVPEKQDKSDTNSSLRSSSEHGSGGELSRSNSQEPVKDRKNQDRVKKKAPWYSALYPTYKSRNEDFKRIFKDIPPDERLVVDYSCAIQRDILVHGRLYVSQNYLSFYANIFRWETQIVLRWKDVTALTKEKTALVIPNAILVRTNGDKHFLTSFAARDKAYLMLFRVWQNALMDQPMSTQEMWQWVHTCYGDELGLTSDDDDYIAPSATEDDRPVPSPKCDSNSLDSYSVEDQVFVSVGEKESEDHEERLDTLPSPGPQPPTPGSPSENLPTDLSDSSVSESGSDKHGCLISCPVLHEGRLMLHMQVSIHVDQLFTHLFTNSKFFFDLHENRKSTDVKQSPWVTNPSTNQKGRTVSHTMPLGQAIGPKSAQITESQKMLPCSKPGEIYAIETEACNAGVPYAEAFYVSCHYCLTRGADPNTSTIAVYSQIKYRKSVWGLVKGYIEKNCWAGMEEYFSYLVKALEKECERTRRAMASGIVGTKRKVSRRRRSTALKSLPLPVCPVPVEEKPLIQPLQLPTQPPVNTQPDTLLWIVFIVLFFLLVLNAALYYKLWGLERNEQLLSSATHELDLEAMRNIPQNTEEWKTLLLKQEKLHSVEVGKWLRILKASVHLLQQVEHSLSALQSSIQGIMGENLYSAIKENSGADSSHSTDDL